MTRVREVIDSELRLLAAVRRTVAEEGGLAPDIEVVDELLDERNRVASHCAAQSLRDRGGDSVG